MKVNSFDKNMLFTTVPVTTDLGGGMQSSGTCFFYNAGGETSTQLILVTNKHVIEGALTGSLQFTRLTADNQWTREDAENEPDLGNPIRVDVADVAAQFVGHPDPEIDVAVMAMNQLFVDLHSRGDHIFVKSVRASDSPRPDQIEDLDALEPIVFVGYPSGLMDVVHGTPIMRTGVTATPIELDYCGRPQFLIDASVFRGSSGSPVFATRTDLHREGGVYVTGPRHLVVGIVAAVHLQLDQARLVSTGPQIQFDQVIDLGLVYKWTAIEEAIEELYRQRGWPSPSNGQ